MEKKGLSSEEAKKSLEKYGTNELQDLNKKGPLKILFRQIKSNFVIYLLLFAMIISFAVGKNLTAYVILGVIIIVIATVVVLLHLQLLNFKILFFLNVFKMHACHLMQQLLP